MKKNKGKKMQRAAQVEETDKPPAHRLSAAEVVAAGKRLREDVPLEAHRTWKRPADRPDPLDILRSTDASRVKRLVPIRYGRMLQSAFTFYRGSAAVMAGDLANTPATGVHVQACGDCHLLNFGGFATPERNILFDINDFDETTPAPWEWDVKRLVASFVLAARSNGLSDSAGRDAAVACTRSYREHIDKYAHMTPLEVWYAQVCSADFLALLTDAGLKGRVRKRIAKAAKRQGSEIDFPQLAGLVNGQVRIHDNPPLIFHPDEARAKDFQSWIEENLTVYRSTLRDDHQSLFDRYRPVDAAMKVVGIGSVGTRCAIVLLMSMANDPLFLQVKEAGRSVLETYAGKNPYPHHGQRVVMGQRLMQPASDIFLGWITMKNGRQGYVRQLRDAKIKPMVETFDGEMLKVYGEACGWTLARAHAKAGDGLRISGYLGSKDVFDEAMGDFALAYADQAERDHAALKAAVRAGKIEAYME